MIDSQETLSPATARRNDRRATCRESATTFVDLLRKNAETRPDQRAFRLFTEKGDDAELSHGELAREACRVAQLLRSTGLAPGEPVVLLFPFGFDFVRAFFGCLAAGAIAVPTIDPSRLHRTQTRLVSILDDVAPRIGLTVATLLPRLATLEAQGTIGAVRWLAVDDGPAALASLHDADSPDPDSVAMIQYTSGSMARPKGVVLSHRNLVHNQRSIGQVVRQTAASKFVGWLPPYHDMGLIGLILHPVYLGAECMLLPTFDFLRRPFRWLEAVSRTGGTSTVAPNFAFDLCVERITDEERRQLDLSTLEAVINGAEPVREETLERFCEVFAPCGIRREAILPCYGLAEATLLVSGRRDHGSFRTHRIEPEALAPGNVLSASPSSAGCGAVSCGGAAEGCEIRIVDPETRKPCPSGQAGEIWVAGGGVGLGYWNQPGLSEEVFRARLADGGRRKYLRTGDIGFLDREELFVSGRRGDLIVLRGRNIHPEDVELTATASHEAARSYACAAFSVGTPRGERLIVAKEVKPARGLRLAEVAEAIGRAVIVEHDVEPLAVVLLRPHGIPRTSSGKIRRQACRRAYQEGILAELYRYEPGGSGRERDVPCPGREDLLRQSAPERLSCLEDALCRLLVVMAPAGSEQPSPERAIAELSLDSLQIARLQHRLQEKLGITPPVSELLGGATPRDVAKSLACRVGEEKEDAASPPVGDPEEREGELRCRLTPGQTALWFDHERDPVGSAYHLGGAIRLRRAPDLSVLRGAFVRLMERHASLRSTFEAAPGGPVQRVHAQMCPPFELVDASTWTEAKLSESLDEDLNRSFDLRCEPPIRLRVYTLAEGGSAILLVAHHLAVDFMSLEVLLEEFTELYQAAARGIEPQLPPQAATFAEHVRLCEQRLGGEKGEQLRRFWEKQLKGEVPVLDLPQRIGTATTRRRAARRTRQLRAVAAAEIAAAARRQGVTSFVLLLSALKILLYRYTQQTDLAVATVVAARPSIRFERTVGYFANTVVLRSEVDGGDSGDKVVRGVREHCLAALDHSAYPFPEVIRERRRRGVRDGITDLRTLFVHYGAEDGRGAVVAAALQLPGVELELGDCRVETLELQRRHCQLDLHWAVAARGGLTTCTLEYDLDRFEVDTIERMLGHFETLLSSLVRHPGRRVSQLCMLSDAEQTQLDGWNETEVLFNEAHVLHELVESQVRRTPSAVAVSCGERFLSYAELDRAAADLASFLATAGARPGQPVAVLLHPGVERVVALVAILKAGCPYIPMDPDDGIERIRRMLSNAGANLVVTVSQLVERVGPENVSSICLDREVVPRRSASARQLLPRVHPDNLAYVIYTSGSTGEPKGAMISHRAICNRLLWMRDHYPLRPSDRILQKTPYTFDVSVWELFLPLIAGVEMVVAPPGCHRDPAALVRLIRSRAVTILHFVPTMLRQFLEEPGVEECRSLRHVFSSGEALSAALRDHFFERSTAELHNLYGPTEAAVDVTSWHCKRDTPSDIVPIGRPIANLRLFVLDGYGQHMPVGVPGELYIGGAGLGQGYWGRSGLTAAHFVPLSVSAGETVRAYRTGDRARYLSDGSLEFLGRLDHQLKIRGVRVEPGEVEAAIRAHPGIRDCVVVARELRPGARGAPQLVAYLVAGTESVRVEELRTFLGRRLPAALIPAHFYALDELPTTSSGKLRRSVLPPAVSCRRLTSSHYEAPANEVEALLASIWSDVLALPEIGVTDDFFELGGDSLHCLKARAGALRSGYSFTIEQLFERPNIRDLAPVVERTDTEASDCSIQPFVLVPDEVTSELRARYVDAFPLSRLQEALLFHSQTDTDYEIYMLSITVQAPFDEHVLGATLDLLAVRHPMLRVSYDGLASGRLLQVVHRSVSLPLEVCDLCGASEPEQERRIDAWLDSERRRRFDWSVAPLLRICVHRRSSAAFQLTASHALYDGWSLSSLLVELLREYAARLAGRPSPLAPAPRIGYQDFVHAERQAQASSQCRDFWRRKLANPAASQLARGLGNGSGRGRRRTSISPHVAVGLRRLARSARVPLKSVLLAVHLRVVSLLTGEHTVRTGLITNGRLEQPGGDRVIGQFLNTVPIKASFRGGSWRDVATQVFREEQEMWPHRRYPFVDIRSLAGETSLDTAFNFVDLHAFDELQGEDVGRVVGWKNPSDVTYFPLCAYFVSDPLKKSLLFCLDYEAGLFDPHEAERVLAYYTRAGESAAREPDAVAGEIRLLSAAELAAVQRWSVPRRRDEICGKDTYRAVHRLFEDAVARCPEAVAVTSELGDLSYAELNRQANRLAWHLISVGATAETPVGVLSDRSQHALIAMLAVMKAGAAFVPIHPNLPQARRLAIQSECGVDRVIVDSLLPPDIVGLGVLQIEVGSGKLSGCPVTDPDIEAPSDGLAYVMYTSGSTGRPKGVEVTHAAWSNVIQAMGREVGISARDAWLAVTSLSFDISLLELLSPLVAGGRVVIADEGSVHDGRDLARWLESSRATVMQATPSMWRLLLEAGWTPKRGLRILSGGETLTRPLARDLLERASAVWNVYGPTETTIWSTISRLTPAGDVVREPAIGGPLANTALYVLDQNWQWVPAGVAGELYIGGLGVARGYRHQPAHTADRFLADPFCGVDGARMYRTGDRVRWRDGGTLEYLGRIDSQIKIRGCRMEVGEIECVLRDHPEVREAVVTACALGSDDVRLIAHVLPLAGRAPEPAGLKRHAARSLPSYMVPAEIVCVSAFPLTPNGKLNRRALATAYRPRPAEPTRSGEEMSETERVIADVWKELLQCDGIRRDESLFDRGAHSLLVMRACARIRHHLQTELEPMTLFEHPTIAALAAFLEGRPCGAAPPRPMVPRAQAVSRLRPLAERRRAAWAGRNDDTERELR